MGNSADDRAQKRWADLKKRIGARFLLEREQVQEWSRTEAAAHAIVDAGVIRRIELGQNYKIDALFLYAHALGASIEDWLFDVLRERSGRSEAPRPAAGADFPESAAPRGGIEKRPASGERRS